MSHFAFFLVILAGFIHAMWNIAAKKAGGDARFACLSNLILMVVWAPVGIYFGWDVVPDWGWKEWSFIVASGVLHGLYFVTLLRGYRKSELTVVYPMARGFAPLISSFAALFLLGEQISLFGVLGILAVVGGVFLIAGGPKIFRAVLAGSGAESQRKRIHKGIYYGLLTGIFIAAYTVLDGYAVKVLLLAPVLLYYFCNFFQVAFLLPALWRNQYSTIVSWRSQWKYALIVAVVSPISYVLVLYAMQIAPLSHVAPAREVSMLFAALIGGRLLGEGDRVIRIVGAVFIAGGVIALGI
ncbi:DMT family transporter [Solimicrobium silvestre]|uniref:EamA-like transporter family n=1 Tax=Solimicrobium silvestre TaxID=2099400 RepID=A0A2S9GYQ1_9BURK|nr:DMT family transporter [Solimicrobium silvestre]PRC92857.1 EamA-like transporter family [Solimicrobium silvestre]